MTYEDFVKINDRWEAVGHAYFELGEEEAAYKIGAMLDHFHEMHPEYNRRRLAEKQDYEHLECAPSSRRQSSPSSAI